MSSSSYAVAAAQHATDSDVLYSTVIAGRFDQPADEASLLVRRTNRELGADAIQEIVVGDPFVAGGTGPNPRVLRLDWDGGFTPVGSETLDGAAAYLGAIIGSDLLYSPLGPTRNRSGSRRMATRPELY